MRGSGLEVPRTSRISSMRDCSSRAATNDSSISGDAERPNGRAGDSNEGIIGAWPFV